VPTLLTHAVVAAGLAQLGPPGVSRGRLAVGLAALSMLPDLDVVAFAVGIPYAHPLGHRGVTHSLLFAAVVAGIVAALGFRALRLAPRRGWAVYGLCFAALASHGVLDACTNGGLGTGFFIPFDDTRYFLPFRPIRVSPIGISDFFAGPAVEVLWSEIQVVWVPLAVIVVGCRRLAR